MPFRQPSHRVPRGTRLHDDYDRRVRAQDPELALAKKLRSSARWQHVRKQKLARNPLCEDPYGRHTTFAPATEVDHILPLRILAGAAKAFDLDALQSLCRACHARKSGSERALHRRGVL